MEVSFISKRQFNRIKHLLPVPRGNKIYDNRLVISAILWIIRYGVQWSYLPVIYGNYQAIYKRFLRWSSMGIFENIFYALRDKIKIRNTVMLDSTFVKAHRTAASLRSDGKPRNIGRSWGGLTTKIHLLCNEEAEPIDFCITPGQTHDVKAAPELIERNLRRIKNFIADKAYDAFKIRGILKGKRVCIPPKTNRKNPESYDKSLYSRRHIIENMFSKLKDWRGLAMRYNRCAHTFHSFVSMGLIAIFFCVLCP